MLCTKSGPIRQATALYYTIPALGKYNTTSHWRRVSILHHFASPFRQHEKLAAFAVGGKPFAKLYRFLERHAFREGALDKREGSVKSIVILCSAGAPLRLPEKVEDQGSGNLTLNHFPVEDRSIDKGFGFRLRT